MTKRLEGRDEPIIEPGIRIVDAHHHLFDRPNLRYLLDDFLGDAAAGHHIVGSVYVETQAMVRARGPAHLSSLGEIEFANGMGAMSSSGRYGDARVCAAIVGFADLSAGDRIAELLDKAQAAAPERFRGVRQMTFAHPGEALKKLLAVRFPEGILKSDGFRQGLRQVASRGLSFDATVFHTQIPELAELADAFPDTTMVLNHLGMAMGYGLDADGRAEVFREWRTQMIELARRPNVVCKVGGLGMPFWGFGLEARKDVLGFTELADHWRPYVETGIEIFGANRCLMESNFPLEGVSCGYVPFWNAMKHIVRDASPAEKSALFHDTAVRVYRIDLESA